MAIEAWYMDDSSADQRLEHRQEPNVPVSMEELTALGVEQYTFDPSCWEEDLKELREKKGYTYHDIVDIHKDRMPGYEEKLKIFFTEHIHADDEIRAVLDGSGYFDVRDGSDRWIRVSLQKGAMIVLPAGILHRFTLDSNNYIKALRLFVGDPVWTPINRADEAVKHDIRQEYVKKFLSGTEPSSTSTKRRKLEEAKEEEPPAAAAGGGAGEATE